jgi:hypothetical protein
VAEAVGAAVAVGCAVGFARTGAIGVDELLHAESIAAARSAASETGYERMCFLLRRNATQSF